MLYDDKTERIKSDINKAINFSDIIYIYKYKVICESGTYNISDRLLIWIIIMNDKNINDGEDNDFSEMMMTMM